jgi:hypothetical protein
MSVQQQLMRHASIQTTMNVYGQAMPETERQANSKIVQMVLREPKKPTGTACLGLVSVNGGFWGSAERLSNCASC